MTLQEITKLEWWVPVPWVIALLGVALAAFTFYRSRYPSAYFHKITSYGSARPPNFEETWYLRVDILCRGADIFEPKLFLECFYSKSKSRHCWPDVLTLHFYPVTEAPNPIKNGQVVTFQLTDSHLKRALELNGGYHCLPSELFRYRTRLALYASGEKLVAKTSSRSFREHLKLFCQPCASFVRVGSQREGWSHQYMQPSSIEQQ